MKRTRLCDNGICMVDAVAIVVVRDADGFTIIRTAACADHLKTIEEAHTKRDPAWPKLTLEKEMIQS